MFQKPPRGYLASGWNIGLKPDKADFGVVYSPRPCTSAAVFTRNVFCGQPILVGREHARSQSIQAIIVNSGNANVATGPQGLDLVYACCRQAAANLGLEPVQILPSSTGVIARQLPEQPMLQACAQLKERLLGPDFAAFNSAIMTTDAWPKFAERELGDGTRILGVAKGAGMIQPDMATMLSYLFTDAACPAADLQRLLESVVSRSFNRISVDSDTSTSDTVALLANGAHASQIRFPAAAAQMLARMSWPIDPATLRQLPLDQASLEFVQALLDICVHLARRIAADGEGATTLIELQIHEAVDAAQALAVGRSIINSPLVKTAVTGADPNWGRLLMAIGKTFDTRLKQDRLRIFFGDLELAGNLQSPDQLRAISEYLREPEIVLKIMLGLGNASETLWGCDLTGDYVHLNSMYTT
ncbi:MAG: bifunctional ornithine acetyltransferase/N-acetylglutamate synthase [Leptospiraceae bacterium]|nr:bifunctional ornithine acetyltransferase/N-acetylglutamate synthase [Leptospiraceae bacterium]